ncbi:PH-like domain-containing protein [Enteractinococcus helveticum]|uniref:PH domain-containing protein n=1 Tax=Enteractinococcus helveticum TaxID=1837282 RepID=A0A1B7LZJ4_9MICC|nr:hypothetical protein [Enteractinococcus helveticum]OAV60913.1 hypothetical protein A6F49_10600 [Enteractinococcus helveticum]
MDETTFIVTLTSAIVVLMILGIIFGRRNRTKRQQYVPIPHEVPAALLEKQPQTAVEGTYVSTVLGQELLERVTAHRLGNPAEAQIEVHHDGVALLRAGEPNIFIPTADLVTVSTVSGIAGKFVEKDGILAITWNLGDVEVTTGLRIESITAHQQLLTALEQLTNGRQTA